MLNKAFILILMFISISIPVLNSDAQLSEQAKEYHRKGQQAMGKNDLDTAIKFFQKAISLNPYSAPVHNDLGIAYEKKAMLERAKVEYKKAISIQPDYAPAYMNLAMLEESMGNIEEAVFYWKARIAFGRAGDEWSKRAKLKLKKYAPQEAKKIDAGLLMEEVLNKLRLGQKQKNKLANKHVGYGKAYFNKAEYSRALDEFRIAAQLSPQDINIQKHIAQTVIQIMHQYYTRGIRYFKQQDYESARYNFKKLLQMVSEFESK